MAALPGSVWDRWLPQLESVELLLGEALHEPGATLSHVYFPTSAIVSLLYVMENGAAAEIAVVGDDGIVGVCNRHHSLDQQLCRWLLLSLDRLEGSDLVMTQELIANMLGVRREGVTEAAAKLQQDGLIRYARGHIRILDRVGLEKRTCECYAVVRREYERLLPKLTRTLRS